MIHEIIAVNSQRRTGVVAVDADLDGMSVVDEFIDIDRVVRDNERTVPQSLIELRLGWSDHDRRLTLSTSCWSYLRPVARSYNSTHPWSIHPSQLSLAIPSWVGAISTGQRAVMPRGWGVKAGMVRVWATGKAV